MTDITLGYMGLCVSDVAAWKAYGRDFLGTMDAHPSPSGISRLRLDDHAWRIALEPGDLDDVAWLGFEVAGPAELDRLRARLAAANYAYAQADAALLHDRGVMDLITLTDPQGMGVELYYGPTLATHEPFVSSQGVRFVTGDQGLGHAAIATTCLAEMRRLYIDILGFRQSDTIRMQLGPDFSIDLEFLYGNPRHHTLALAPVPMAMPKRTHHIMVQVETLDQVGHALDRAQGAGVRITQTLGRHSNDKMVSFYCATPSGIELEYGQGAIEVDPATWHMARHDRISSWGHKPV